MKLLACITLLAFFISSAHAQRKVAVVKVLRGEVDVLTMGKSTRLKLEDWVEDGSVVKTAEKSFVKLIFIDKSQMNIGPVSEMKIEKFSGKDSGVIDLVKGKIRSQVTKDYLQMDNNKSKLFIKTANAVMGVRGTDFIIATNGTNTSTILFEGAIAFNKLENRGEANSQKLEDIVNRGVQMYPGEFSVVDGRGSQPTIPSLINIQQREKLEKSEAFEAVRTPGNSAANEVTKSVVPEGLNGTAVGNDASVLKNELSQVPVAKPEAGAANVPASNNPESFEQGGRYKPANGSFLHVDTGVIIAPTANSVYDANSNTYIPSNSGTVSANGDYVPPKNMEITPDGQVMVVGTDAKGQSVVQKVDTNTPVITVAGPNPTSNLSVKPGGSHGDHSFNDQGGLSNYHNNKINTGGVPVPGTSGQFPNETKTTIKIYPK